MSKDPDDVQQVSGCMGWLTALLLAMVLWAIAFGVTYEIGCGLVKGVEVTP